MDALDFTAFTSGAVAAPANLSVGETICVLYNTYKNVATPTISYGNNFTEVFQSMFSTSQFRRQKWAFYYKVAEAGDIGSSNLGFSDDGGDRMGYSWRVPSSLGFVDYSKNEFDVSSPHITTHNYAAAGSNNLLLYMYVEDQSPTSHSIGSQTDSNGNTLTQLAWRFTGGLGGMLIGQVDRQLVSKSINVSIDSNPSNPNSPFETGLGIFEFSLEPTEWEYRAVT